MSKKLANGYEQIYQGIDPKTGKEIWEYKHRLAAGAKRGDGTVVHHKNGDKSDSSKGNLEKLKSRGKHNSKDPALHRGGRKKGS